MAKRRRTARQSANVQEYRRLRRNLMARLRYREKQGFKVDYTTVPKTMEYPTARDIEKLVKTQVKQNRYGEVVATRQGRATRQFKDITRQDVITQKEILKEFGQEGGDMPRTTPQAPVLTDLDYVGMVYSTLTDISDRALLYYNDAEYSSTWNADEWAVAYMGLYDNLYEVVENEFDRVGEERLNQYYGKRWEEISTAISKFLDMPLSRPEEVIPVGESMIKYLLICP